MDISIGDKVLLKNYSSFDPHEEFEDYLMENNICGEVIDIRHGESCIKVDIDFEKFLEVKFACSTHSYTVYPEDIKLLSNSIRRV